MNEFINFVNEIKDLEGVIAYLKKNCPDEVETIHLVEAVRDYWKRMMEEYKDK